MATLAMKKRSGVSVRYVMMVALVATCFVHQLHARNTIIDILTAGTQLEGGKGNGKDCCDVCVCTLSYPDFSCFCVDVGDTCYAGCKNCECTGFGSGQCRCLDIGQNQCPQPICPSPSLVTYNEAIAIARSTHADPTA